MLHATPRPDRDRFQSTLPARGATAARAPCFSRPRHFNPRSPRGERQQPRKDVAAYLVFQSTLPARGATRGILGKRRKKDISIHAPREGSDSRQPEIRARERISIHAPHEGSDKHLYISIPAAAYFNPRSPRGERPAEEACKVDTLKISIHAPREGSDIGRYAAHCAPSEHFNPRSPRGERLKTIINTVRDVLFQSTLPARGATVAQARLAEICSGISIHAPREGSDQKRG